MQRYYLHGDRTLDGRIYCASCDMEVADVEHFQESGKHCSKREVIAARLKSTRRELIVLQQKGYFRPSDAENVLI